MVILNDPLITLIQAPYAAIWASNTNARQLPDLVRLSGVRVNTPQQQLILFVSLKFGETFLKNIQSSKRVSFLCASVKTLESYQLKGTCLSSHPCTPEEIDYQETYIDGFCKAVEYMGISSRQKFFDCFFQQPSVAVRMQVEEIFEQTPKPGTGQKLSTP